MFNTVEGRILLTAENDTRQAIGEVADSLQELKRIAGDASSTTAEAMTGLGRSGHEARRAFDDAGMSATRFGAIIGLAAGAAQAAGEVIGKAIKSIPEFVMDSEREFEKHSVLVNTMSADIKNLGLGARVSLVGIQEEARKLSDSWGVSEEAILGASKVMLRNLPASNAQMKQMTELATNMAADMGVDIPVAADQLVRAVHSAGRAINVLERSGVYLTRTDRLMLEQWDQFGMQGNIVSFLLSHLSERYRGLAAEANKNVYGTNALAGAWEHLHLAVGEGVNPLWQQGLKLVAGGIAAVSDGIDDFRKKGVISTLNEMILKLAEFSGITPFEEWARGLTDAGTKKALTDFIAGAKKFVDDTINEFTRLGDYFDAHGIGGSKQLAAAIKDVEWLLAKDKELDEFFARITGTRTQAEINAGPAVTDAERRGEAITPKAPRPHARFEDFLTPLDRRRPWLDHPTRGYGAPHSELLTPEAEAARYDRKYSPLLDTREQRDYDRAIRGIRDQQSGDASGGRGRLQFASLGTDDIPSWYKPDRQEISSEKPSWYHPQEDNLGDAPKAVREFKDETSEATKELDNFTRLLRHFNLDRGWLGDGGGGTGGGGGSAPGGIGGEGARSGGLGSGIPDYGPTGQRGPQTRWGPERRTSPGKPFISNAPMTAAERNELGLILKYESHGKNVLNYVGRQQGLDPTTAKGYTAQGYFQMLNSNWRRIAPELGIKAPNAMAASFDDQTKVALQLLRQGGIGNWANYNPALRNALGRGETATGPWAITPPAAAQEAAGAKAEAAGATGAPMRTVGNYKSGVDPRLTEILNAASKDSPYKVEAFSGYRPYNPEHPHSFHGQGKATDIRLINRETGQALPNYKAADSFREYEKFAQHAREVQQQLHPELDKQFRWGGYFGGGRGKYGAMDEMHFDLGGSDRLGMAGGSWQHGLTPEQRRRFAGAESVGMADRPSAVAAKEPSPAAVAAQQMAEQQESMQRTTQLGRGQVDLNVKLDRDLRAGKPNVAHAENFDISMGVDRTGASYLARPGSPEYSGVPRI